MLELVAMAWISLFGIQPVVHPWPVTPTAPLLVDTLQFRRLETEIRFRPLDIAFAHIDANELKPFDESFALGAREFENDDVLKSFPSDDRLR
jgi:hypothetical protein